MDLRREFDDMLTRFFGEQPEPPKAFTAGFPAMDVSETDKDIIIKAELPGMGPDDLDVSLNKGVLTIKGEKKEEREANEKGRHTVERVFGGFLRSVTLPAEVQEEKITAKFKNGVLCLTMPKIEEAQKNTIKIDVE
jgi:HSP20 family protein